MKVALFIPCYVDQFYPQVGIASLQLLRRLGVHVHYPTDQTCCGQPLANSGLENDARPIYEHFVRTFGEFDHIVAPSGSCTYHVQHHYDILDQSDTVRAVRARTIDLTDFLVDVLKLQTLPARFPHRVGLHRSCHGLRGLRQARASELMIPEFSKLEYLLSLVRDLELVPLERRDECCGFGGTFAVNEPAVSVRMGEDRLADHRRAGAEFVTAGDMSCLMHLEGLARRRESSLRFVHLAEILNSSDAVAEST